MLYNTALARSYRLLQLLLGADVVGVATLALAAVGRLRVQTGVAPEKGKRSTLVSKTNSFLGHSLSADHLVAVVLLSENAETGLDDTASQTEHQMKGRLWVEERE